MLAKSWLEAVQMWQHIHNREKRFNFSQSKYQYTMTKCISTHKYASATVTGCTKLKTETRHGSFQNHPQIHTASIHTLEEWFFNIEQRSPCWYRISPYICRTPILGFSGQKMHYFSTQYILQTWIRPPLFLDCNLHMKYHILARK